MDMTVYVNPRISGSCWPIYAGTKNTND